MKTTGMALAANLPLPLDAVTQTFACIGRKGAGKTYLAQTLAEQMLDSGAQVVALDPVGNWYGLRVAADGKGKGKDIFLAGGEHGDVPLAPGVGAIMARIVVSKGISIVLDVSGFRQGERKRFAADFAEEFFHVKKTQRSAVHLFVEEAQLFVPQRCGSDEARMLGAYENIIRLGRNYGIGATLISQRPQSVNKEVLSQVECLCVLQVNGAHERKAIEEWVQEKGADRKVVGELPGLERGEGFVWSPSWLRRFERVRFAGKTTFDASATPEVGKTSKAALLTAVDVEALKADLHEVIASAEKDDPKALRRRIAELERQVAVPAAPSRALADAEREEWKSACSALRRRVEEQDRAMVSITHMAKKVIEAGEAIRTAMDSTGSGDTPEPKMVLPRLKPAAEWPKPSLPPASDRPALRAGARRMLAVLAQWHPSGRTEAQVAAQVQMKRTGGTWGAYKSDLKNGGYLEMRAGLWFATETGRAYVGGDTPERPATTEEVVRLWGEKLRRGAREILDTLVRHGGDTVSRVGLGEAVGMEPSGGTFTAYLSDLKQAGLILVDRDGVRANRETLFL